MSFNVQSLIDRDSALWQALRAWPKIELHRHLEGSIRLPTLIDVAHEYAIPLPAYSVEDLRPYVQMTGSDRPDFAVFLSKFDVLRQFYRSLPIIRRIAYEAVEDAAQDNVRYMELRFTPHALTRQNDYGYQEIIEGVCEAVQAAQAEHDIQVRLIVSVNRHESVEIAEQVLAAAIACAGCGIVGMDLAGKEVGFAAHAFRPVLHTAQENGLHLTVHAGEWEGAANVRHAIEAVGAERIGHGVRAIEDSTVIQLVRERGITLEVCPTSNLHTGVVPSLEQHPLADLAYLDVRTTINTDDPSLSNITLTDELVLAHLAMGLPLDLLKTNILNAAEAAFLPDDERAALVSRFRAALDAAPLP
ncbi:MAG: adenosine deaminase [Chloroflexi bacterium]|nr:adenosine deaminase [Chloroflexota bacterium]